MDINKWQGLWSDGKSAATHKVQLQLDKDQLIVRFTDAPDRQPIFWSYAELQSTSPIKKNADHVLLTASTHQGERLFIDDKDFAAAILAHSSNLSVLSHQWSMLKWPLAIAAIIAGFFLLTYFDIISPAKRVAFMLPDNARMVLGTSVINMIRKDSKICSSTEGDAALAKLVARLNAATAQKTDFSVRVASMKITNAFAAPGDQIIISSKLIKEADSADEVAGVIAHEMGHSIERHPETNIIRVLGIMSVMQLMTAGEAGAIGEIAFFMVQSGYSRDAEREADEIGFGILTKSKIDTRPLAGFFERIIAKHEKEKHEKEEKLKSDEDKKDPKSSEPVDSAIEKSTTNRKDNSFFDILSTHPPTSARIKYFNSTQNQTSPETLSSNEWQALRNICGKEEETNDKEKEDE